MSFGMNEYLWGPVTHCVLVGVPEPLVERDIWGLNLLAKTCNNYKLLLPPGE